MSSGEIRPLKAPTNLQPSLFTQDNIVSGLYHGRKQKIAERAKVNIKLCYMLCIFLVVLNMSTIPCNVTII